MLGRWDGFKPDGDNFLSWERVGNGRNGWLGLLAPTHVEMMKRHGGGRQVFGWWRNAGQEGSSVEEAAGDALVGVDAAIAEEGPVAAGIFEEFEVYFGGEDFFLVVAGLGEDAAEGIGDEAAAPEFQARAFGALHGNAIVGYIALLEAYAVDGSDEDSVGDGVGSLHGLPGGVLGFAEFGLF